MAAEELGFWRGSLTFAGTPLLALVCVLMHQVAREGDRMCLIILGVGCAFVYGRLRSGTCIDIPEQEPFAKNDDNIGLGDV